MKWLIAGAFGRFPHHTPAEAMRTPVDAQDGIKRARRLLRQPHRLRRGLRRGLGTCQSWGDDSGQNPAE